jgi:glycosyltransferase involved in cell wall biosynthesis
MPGNLILNSKRGIYMKILIIIPAYNEASNLPIVIESLKRYLEYDYVIVNDGSKDETVELCKINKWNLLNLPVNMGLATSIQTGMRFAKLYNYDYAIQIDGDGQHRPEYISSMLDVIQDADIVIGSRFVSERKPGGVRMLGSNLLQFALSLTTRVKITDPTSGMRLYNRKMISIMAEGVDFGPEPDTLAYLIRSGAKVKEVAVKMDERLSGESYLNATTAIKYMVQMFLSIGIFQFVRKKYKY